MTGNQRICEVEKEKKRKEKEKKRKEKEKKRKEIARDIGHA